MRGRREGQTMDGSTRSHRPAPGSSGVMIVRLKAGTGSGKLKSRVVPERIKSRVMW